jgi:hypothetical protein
MIVKDFGRPEKPVKPPTLSAESIYGQRAPPGPPLLRQQHIRTIEICALRAVRLVSAS